MFHVLKSHVTPASSKAWFRWVSGTCTATRVSKAPRVLVFASSHTFSVSFQATPSVWATSHTFSVSSPIADSVLSSKSTPSIVSTQCYFALYYCIILSCIILPHYNYCLILSTVYWRLYFRVFLAQQRYAGPFLYGFLTFCLFSQKITNKSIHTSLSLLV